MCNSRSTHTIQNKQSPCRVCILDTSVKHKAAEGACTHYPHMHSTSVHTTERSLRTRNSVFVEIGSMAHNVHKLARHHKISISARKTIKANQKGDKLSSHQNFLSAMRQEQELV